MHCLISTSQPSQGIMRTERLESLFKGKYKWQSLNLNSHVLTVCESRKSMIRASLPRFKTWTLVIWRMYLTFLWLSFFIYRVNNSTYFIRLLSEWNELIFAKCSEAPCMWLLLIEVQVSGSTSSFKHTNIFVKSCSQHLFLDIPKLPMYCAKSLES